MGRSFSEVFNRKPIIGMIHLAGSDREEKVKRALREIGVYQEEGLGGVIIEDYHGDFEDLYQTLRESSKEGLKIARGINVLRNPYSAFELASDFGAEFVQFDNVQEGSHDFSLYEFLRKKYPEVTVLGGVRFKYTESTGNSLEEDLEYGKARCEAIVTTGTGTGIETPLEKLSAFKELMGDFPLVVGAGVNSANVYEQMQVCDGAIVGSYFKEYNTLGIVQRSRIRELVNALAH